VQERVHTRSHTRITLLRHAHERPADAIH
jgi:hypothetical protein